MSFSKIVNSVKAQLASYSIQEKTQIFKEILDYPISIRDGVFYVYDKEYDNIRYSDYLNIREHWMSVQEFDKLYNYFEIVNKNDK